jgi:glyoxalase superfamily protein
MPADATLAAVVIDSADPAALGDFYSKLTRLDITYSDDTYVYPGRGPGQARLPAGRGLPAPGWPDPAKHSHIDFTVADTESGTKEATALGAGRPDFQPGGDSWVVLTECPHHR